MKKLIMLICAVVTGVTMANAQQAVAVLTHSGTSKTFSGYTALQEAYAEAVSGDLITLSSGSFGAVEVIEKAIKIRGAGMEMDKEYGTGSTAIVGDMTLDIASSSSASHFTLEGVNAANIYYNHTQSHPQFSKCILKGVLRGSYSESGKSVYGTVEDATFYHCKITNSVACGADCSMSFLNCYVHSPKAIDSSSSNMTFSHCVLVGTSTSTVSVGGCTLNDCVAVGLADRSSLNWNDETSFNHCLLVYSSSPKPDESDNSYISVSKMTEAFKTYNSTSYVSTENYELLEGYNSQYGLYSGSFPYSPRLAGPHIEQMEVAPRTTDAGMLNVKIKVTNSTE